MKRMLATLAGVVGLVGVAASAGAQVGVKYKLDFDSLFTQKFCLGPCACPPSQILAPARGTFTITFQQEGPLFRNYSVTLVDWRAVSPSGTHTLRGSGTYRIGGEVANLHQMVLDLSVDSEKPMRYDSGLVVVDPSRPFPAIGVMMETAVFGCRMNQVWLGTRPVRCPADCDGSDILNVNDFLCFINNFAAGDPYANCDGSSTPPVLNVADFVCFLNQYAAGCP